MNDDTVMWQRLDPELVEPLKGMLEATGGPLDLSDIKATREMFDGLIAAMAAQAPVVEGVEIEDRTIPGLDGGPDVGIRVYYPASRQRPAPASLWLHPGGWVLGSIALDDGLCRQMAKDTGCVLVQVEYRLAPEHAFPAALEDCYAALRWLAAHAAELSIDPARIAVGGSSAGGGLAAGTALMARDRGGPDVAFQLLVYPGIDDTNVAPADATRPETLFWTRENNRDAWRAYLGDAAGGPDVPPYAAPARARDLSGLPPAYVAVGSLDLFVDDNASYACRLAAAGVPAELHVYPAACHAFDVFAPTAAVTQRFAAERNAALVRALGAAQRTP